MSRKGILSIVGLTALCLLAFVVRLAPYKKVFSPTPFADGSCISLYGVDPFLHARRIMLSMKTFPRIQYSDPYFDFPEHRPDFMAPIFDQVCVGAAKALGYTAEKQEPLLGFLVFIPPLMGALTLPFVYLLARRMMNEASAWVSTGLLAVMPGHVSYSILGRIDHHVAEMLAAVLMFLVFVALLEKIEKTGRVPSWHAVGLGATIACTLGTSVSSVILIALIPGFIIIVAIVRTARERETRLLEENGFLFPPLFRSTWIAFLVGSVLLIPYCARPPWVGPTHEIHLGLSWSHLYVICLMGLMCLGMDCASRVVRSTRIRAALFPLVAAGVAGLGVAIPALAFPSLVAPLNVAGSLFTGMDPWYQTISEAQPLFFDRGEFRPYYAEAMLTWFVYLYPLMVVTLLVGRFRAKERSVAFDFLLFLLVTLGALGFLRKRLIYFSALNVSLCVAYFLVESVRLVWRKESAGRKPHGFVFRAARIAFIVVVCLVACYPSVNFYWPLSRERHAQARPFFTPPRAMRDTFAWMRDHTPATSFYMDPTRDPEYGVIFSYDYSVWLIFYARRPAIGVLWGLFRREGNDRAFDAFRFLVAESEAEANEICDRDRARYVVTYPILFFVRDYAAITGVDRDRYMVLTRREDTGRPVFRPTDRYWHLIGQRLHERDGVGTEDSPEALPSLQRYRLLYESESFVHPDTGKPSVLKIFEYVKGARITGLTMPLARVKAEVAMVTNQGRQFTYRNSVAADDQGRFTLIVPYATSGGKPGETHAVSRYRVNSLAVDAFADVTEEDILGGREVRVVFPSRRP